MSGFLKRFNRKKPTGGGSSSPGTSPKSSQSKSKSSPTRFGIPLPGQIKKISKGQQKSFSPTQIPTMTSGSSSSLSASSSSSSSSGETKTPSTSNPATTLTTTTNSETSDKPQTLSQVEQQVSTARRIGVPSAHWSNAVLRSGIQGGNVPTPELVPGELMQLRKFETILSQDNVR